MTVSRVAIVKECFRSPKHTTNSEGRVNMHTTGVEWDKETKEPSLEQDNRLKRLMFDVTNVHNTTKRIHGVRGIEVGLNVMNYLKPFILKLVSVNKKVTSSALASSYQTLAAHASSFDMISVIKFLSVRPVEKFFWWRWTPMIFLVTFHEALSLIFEGSGQKASLWSLLKWTSQPQMKLEWGTKLEALVVEDSWDKRA